ncbi:MAG: DUF4160 domain-containing protein [Flavobacteriaceae bacterium]|nr:DUF4160 domain-containing protein [Flavobacteriaceae bacterium]MDZ4147320.1 DUF4160 domain-containing protein [Flavobacteriaceae bacterium]
MPTILFVNGYRFFFYSNDHEPKHVHIEKDGKTAKFNLEPVELTKSIRFSASEIKEIRKIIEQNQALFKLKWDEYFINK